MTAPVLDSAGHRSPRSSSPRAVDASAAAGFGFVENGNVDAEAGNLTPRRTRIELLGDRLQVHLQQAALQSATLASAAERKERTSIPDVAGQIWEDRANAARGMAMRMSERLWNLSGSKAPQDAQPASLEDALSHCDAALTAAEYASKAIASKQATTLATIDGRLKRLDQALQAAATGDTKLARALPALQPASPRGTKDPPWATLVACEGATNAAGKKLADTLAGMARSSEAEHNNQLALRRVKDLERAVRAANDESVAILELNAQLESLISSKLAQYTTADPAPSSDASKRGSKGILLPPGTPSGRKSRVSFVEDIDEGCKRVSLVIPQQRTSIKDVSTEDLIEGCQPRSSITDLKVAARSALSSNLSEVDKSRDFSKSLVAQFEPLDGGNEDRSDNFDDGSFVAEGSFVGSPVKASLNESAQFPSSWVEEDSTDDEDGEREMVRFTEGDAGPMSAFEKAREAAWNEDPPLPSPRKRSSGFDRLGLSPRTGYDHPPAHTLDIPKPVLHPPGPLPRKESLLRKDKPAPQGLTGHLWKKSPSSLRFWTYQKRYIEIRGMFLVWWKSQADAQRSGSFSARGGAPQHAGLIDLRQTPCDIQALGDQELFPTFALQPRAGATWQGSIFSGGDASRVFIFDASDSEHKRDTWVEVIRAHMRHADGLKERAETQQM